MAASVEVAAAAASIGGSGLNYVISLFIDEK